MALPTTTTGLPTAKKSILTPLPSLKKNILQKLNEESLESKLVKTISLIYILEQFECLEPTREELIGIFSSQYGVAEIDNAIQVLVEKEFVVYLKRSNNYYFFV